MFSERLYLAYQRNDNIAVLIARYHNIFGPEGTWTGGKEKVPAALCRKIAQAGPGGHIEIWGDGQKTRSFLCIDQRVEGMLRLMRSNSRGPVNIGSEEMVTVDGLARMMMRAAGKTLSIHHTPGPTGMRGRNSDNRLIRDRLGWAPSRPLSDGLASPIAGSSVWFTVITLLPSHACGSSDRGSSHRFSPSSAWACRGCPRLP